MKDPDDNRGPFELYQDLLATSMSVPREHIDEALEQEQAEKVALQADEGQDPMHAASADPKPAARVYPDETEGTDCERRRRETVVWEKANARRRESEHE